MLNVFDIVNENFNKNKYHFQLIFGKKTTEEQTEKEALAKLRKDLENCAKNIEGIENINLNEVWYLVSSYLYNTKDIKNIFNLYIHIIKNMLEKKNNLGRAFFEESQKIF